MRPEPRLRFMSIALPQLRGRLLLLASTLFCLCDAAHAVQAPASATTGSASGATVATNSAPAQAGAPKSVFNIPTSPQDTGKDPFFPQSTRLRSKPVVASATNVPLPMVALELKGISGALDRRLAIINDRTFSLDEEGEVPTDTGRVRIRVTDIKSDSVVVVVNGQQRVLRLRSGL
jgi:hypothetical protein